MEEFTLTPKLKKLILGVVVAVLIFIGIGMFAGTNNKAISLEEQVTSTRSDIQVQEKRRSDLIYNLADCVKQYDSHEYETLKAIAEGRGGGAEVNGNITTSIAAVAEAYPELKSDTNYQNLMAELSSTENLISTHRKTYNETMRKYNQYVRSFPHNIILNILGYDKIDNTYLEYSEEDTQPIRNMFGNE